MSIELKINNTAILTFDLDTNNIVSNVSNSPVANLGQLANLSTQAQLCSTTQCYKCTEEQCNQVKCTTQQCNQVKCTTYKCSLCSGFCSSADW